MEYVRIDLDNLFSLLVDHRADGSNFYDSSPVNLEELRKMEKKGVETLLVQVTLKTALEIYGERLQPVGWLNVVKYKNNSYLVMEDQVKSTSLPDSGMKGGSARRNQRFVVDKIYCAADALRDLDRESIEMLMKKNNISTDQLY